MRWETTDIRSMSSEASCPARFRRPISGPASFRSALSSSSLLCLRHNLMHLYRYRMTLLLEELRALVFCPWYLGVLVAGRVHVAEELICPGHAEGPRDNGGNGRWNSMSPPPISSF